MTPALRRRLLVIATAIILPTLAAAQTPFDMSPERKDAPDTQASPGDGFVMPFDSGLQQPQPGPGASPKEPAPSAVIPAAPPAEPPAAPTPTPETRTADGVGRYILPTSSLRFEGETGQRSWGVALTADQAARARTLVVTYNSSIYVAPEASTLRVSVNDRLVLDEALSAREADSRLAVAIPAGTLRAGTNIVTFAVAQRHRTDCTIASTYELWTDIEGPGTGLVFDGTAPAGFATLDDLSAVGIADDGTTTIHVVLPGGEQMLADSDILRLVQAIVLRGNFRQPRVEIESEPLANGPLGTLQVAVGTASDLAAIPGLPASANASATVAFAGTAGSSPMLVVSGPDRSAVHRAIDQIAATVDRPPGVAPTVVNTTPWLLPPVPILTGDTRLQFSELAIPTEEFSGRRSHAEFHVALPGDFYAEAYGKATVYLDAAYTAEVKPGSHLDVYVNGQIAANTPLTSRSGDIFRHLPISVALTNFRPGVNRVTIEAVLDTDTDLVCGPGAAAGGPPRFAIFNTSEFRMPDFARINRWPNLAALAGTGTPYDLSEVPVEVVLGREGDQTFAAAATFLSRLAIAADRIIPTEIGHAKSLTGGPAIFVGALDQFSAPTLAAIGVDEAARNAWTRPSGDALSDVPLDFDPAAVAPKTFGDSPATEGVYNRWQNELVNPSGIRGGWLAFESWLQRTFDLSFAALSVSSGPEKAFSPSKRSSLIVAQAPSSGDRSWTLVAAPTADDLSQGLAEITSRQYWSMLSGRIASFDDTTGITNLPAQSQRFILGDGFSLQNMRLVAANWLSLNIVGYALALVVLCVILGICTSALLARLGRRS